MAANHAREVEYAVEMAFERDGRIRGMRAVIHADIGAYVRTAALVPAEFGAALLPGPYRVPAYACDLWSVVTNKTPVGTLRSPGRPECNLARERLMDLASARLALDPAEIRRRNLIRPDQMPYDCGTTSFGVTTVYDSGDFPALFDELLRRLHYDRERAEQARVNGVAGARRGIGLAGYVGAMAAAKPVAEARARAATVWGVPDDAVAYAAGGLTSGGRRLSLAELASERRLAAGASFTVAKLTYAGCAVGVVADVDPETGRVTLRKVAVGADVGRAVNPALIDGQLVGGVAFGIGNTLLESLDYDGQGQLLTGTLMDYALPWADDVPPVISFYQEVTATTNPLG